jgi:hypothetical protein
MAYLPLLVRPGVAETGWDVRCAPAAKTTDPREVPAAMEILVLFAVLLLLALASAAGLTADTRDSADWKPTDDGWRRSSPTS